MPVNHGSANPETSEVSPRYLLRNPDRPFDYRYSEWRARERGDHRSKECIASQESSITSSGGVTVVALPGLYDDELYEQLPVCNHVFSGVEMATITQMKGFGMEEIAERIYLSGDEEKLMRYIADYTERFHGVLEEEIGPFDLGALTPSQAIYLAGRIVRTSMDYDYAAYDRPPNFQRIQDPMERERVTRLYNHDKKGYRKWHENRNKLLNSMTTLERMHFGKGICRHYAEDTAKVFYALKTGQRDMANSKLANVDVFMYTPSGEARDFVSDEDHAYNIVLVRVPTADDRTEAIVSVFDTTWNREPENPNDYDQTTRRLSSVIGFVKVNGSALGIEKPVDQALELANLALARFKTPPNNDLLADYMAMKKFVLSAANGTGNLYTRVCAKTLKEAKEDRMGLLFNVLNTPLVKDALDHILVDDFYDQVMHLPFDSRDPALAESDRRATLGVAGAFRKTFYDFHDHRSKGDYKYTYGCPGYRNLPYFVVKTYVENSEMPGPKERKILHRALDALPKVGEGAPSEMEAALMAKYYQMERATIAPSLREKISGIF